MDRKGRPLPIQYRPDGTSRWREDETDWASQPCDPPSPRQKIVKDAVTGPRNDLRTTKTGNADLDARLSAAKNQLADLNAQAARRGQTIAKTQEAVRRTLARGFVEPFVGENTTKKALAKGGGLRHASVCR